MKDMWLLILMRVLIGKLSEKGYMITNDGQAGQRTFDMSHLSGK